MSTRKQLRRAYAFCKIIGDQKRVTTAMHLAMTSLVEERKKRRKPALRFGL